MSHERAADARPPAPSPGRPISAREALTRFPVIRRWVLAEVFSAGGDQFFIVTLAVLAARHGAATAGLVLAAGTLPGVLAALVAGAVVDRIGYRRAMLMADLGRMALLVVAAAAWWGSEPQALALALTAALVGLVGSLYEPAAIAVAPSIAPTTFLSPLYAARLTAMRAGMLAGAPLAGLALATVNPSLALLIDAASFVVTAAAAWALPSRGEHQSMKDSVSSPGGTTSSEAAAPAAAPGLWRTIWQGYRYIGGAPVLLFALGSLALLEFALTGPVNVGLPLLAQARDWGPDVVGFVLAAFAAGAVAGPSLALTFGRRWSHLALPAGLAITSGAGLCYALSPRADAPAIVAVSAAGLGIGSSWLAGTLVPVLQEQCDTQYLGRLGGAMSFTFQGITPLSILATGLAAQHFALAGVFAFAGLLTVASCMALAARRSKFFS